MTPAARVAETPYHRTYVAQQREQYGLPTHVEGVPVTSHQIMWLDHFITPLGVPWTLEADFDGNLYLQTKSSIRLPDGSRMALPRATIQFNGRGYWLESSVQFDKNVATPAKPRTSLLLKPVPAKRQLTVPIVEEFLARAITADLHIPNDPDFRYSNTKSWLRYFTSFGVAQPAWVPDAVIRFKEAQETRRAAEYAAQCSAWDTEAHTLAVEALIQAHQQEFDSLLSRAHTFVRLRGE